MWHYSSQRNLSRSNWGRFLRKFFLSWEKETDSAIISLLPLALPASFPFLQTRWSASRGSNHLVILSDSLKHQVCPTQKVENRSLAPSATVEPLAQLSTSRSGNCPCHIFLSCDVNKPLFFEVSTSILISLICNLLLQKLLKLLSCEDRNACQLDLRGNFTDLSETILIWLPTKTVCLTLPLQVAALVCCQISFRSIPLMLSLLLHLPLCTRPPELMSR